VFISFRLNLGSFHTVTAGAFLVTLGNGTFVPRTVLIRSCHARIPPPE